VIDKKSGEKEDKLR